MPKDDLPTLRPADLSDWERWLESNHGNADGVWLKLAKKSSDHAVIAYAELLDTAICFGWIDGQRAPLDESFFLQRFTPRRARSNWSQVNRIKAERLTAEGRMRPAGREQIEAAKQDGRWERAYEPQSRATIPEDFQQELDRNPVAKEFFATLTGTRRYAFLYRIREAKRAETRARRIAQFIEVLNERKTLFD
jgi:uncharacterized protein YdeI (YjbR/CyaY-like superfamily)